MNEWYKGRIVLVGDAAHAILPTAGVGASMAMKSAAVLAEELTRTDSQHVELALERYVRRRKDRVFKILDQSRTMGKFAVVSNGLLTAVRNEALHFLPQNILSRYFHDLLAGPI